MIVGESAEPPTIDAVRVAPRSAKNIEHSAGKPPAAIVKTTRAGDPLRDCDSW